MLHILHPGGRQSLSDRMREILQDHSPGHTWILLLELLALVANASANIDVHSFPVLVRIPPFHLSVDRIYRKPRKLGLTTERHVVIEVRQMPRVLSKPLKCMEWCLPSILKSCVQLVYRVAVFRILQEAWQRLVLRPGGIEAETVLLACLQQEVLVVRSTKHLLMTQACLNGLLCEVSGDIVSRVLSG